MRRRSVAGWKWVYIVSGRDRIEHERRGGKENMVWKTPNLWSEDSDSQLRMILPPKRYLATVITTGDDASSGQRCC